MGVDCVATFPWRTRVSDVADVIGILAGLPAEQYSIAKSDGVFMQVNGVKVENCDHQPTMVTIKLDAGEGGKLVDGEQGHYTFWHFEGQNGPSTMPRSTPFWIAVMRRAVEFFGGTLVYSDCGDMEPDLTFPEQPDIHTEDNPGWDAFQLRKLSVKPITKQDMIECREVAAYK